MRLQDRWLPARLSKMLSARFSTGAEVPHQPMLMGAIRCRAGLHLEEVSAVRAAVCLSAVSIQQARVARRHQHSVLQHDWARQLPCTTQQPSASCCVHNKLEAHWKDKFVSSLCLGYLRNKTAYACNAASRSALDASARANACMQMCQPADHTWRCCLPWLLQGRLPAACCHCSPQAVQGAIAVII